MSHANPFPSLSRPKTAFLTTPRPPSIRLTSPGGNERELQGTRWVPADLEKRDSASHSTSERSSNTLKLKLAEKWKCVGAVVVLLLFVVGISVGMVYVRRMVDWAPVRHGLVVG